MEVNADLPFNGATSPLCNTSSSPARANLTETLFR